MPYFAVRTNLSLARSTALPKAKLKNFGPPTRDRSFPRPQEDGAALPHDLEPAVANPLLRLALRRPRNHRASRLDKGILLQAEERIRAVMEASAVCETHPRETPAGDALDVVGAAMVRAICSLLILFVDDTLPERCASKSLDTIFPLLSLFVDDTLPERDTSKSKRQSTYGCMAGGYR